MPASYATASSSAGPPFSVQVKVAKPVVGYNQPRRRAEPAYGPPSPQLGYGAKPPPQYASEPGSRARPHEAEPWYPEPPSYGRRLGEGDFYTGPAGQARLGAPLGQYQAGLVKAGKDELAAPQIPAGTGGLRFPHQPPPCRPEEELDRLTKKLIYDLNNPPTAEYFGRCAQCGENVVGDGTGCVAMDQGTAALGKSQWVGSTASPTLPLCSEMGSSFLFAGKLADRCDCQVAAVP
ncbi:lipoma-preferred partner homolog [Python bivittatus]|uniref:Lipoma-preferred partner homolog n=1 Tax=Python bivittatus TaxID=176946 RepID=A0A9F5IQ55_PYTBI|nr:lipoma-preferred partner homolog [Python bivittatus]